MGFDKNKKRDNPYIKNLSRLVTQTYESSNFLYALNGIRLELVLCLQNLIK